MKKIILSLFVLIIIFTIVGCEDNDKKDKSSKKSSDTKEELFEQEPMSNSFTCQGKLSFMTDFIISHGPTTKDEDKSEDMEYWSIGFPGEYTNNDLEKSKLTFIYDNNKLITVRGKEVYTEAYTKKVTSQLTEEQIKEENGKTYKKDGTTYKTYIKDNQIIMEYTIDSNDDFVKVFNNKYPTKSELKKVLEEKTVYTCD